MEEQPGGRWWDRIDWTKVREFMLHEAHRLVQCMSSFEQHHPHWRVVASRPMNGASYFTFVLDFWLDPDEGTGEVSVDWPIRLLSIPKHEARRVGRFVKGIVRGKKLKALRLYSRRFPGVISYRIQPEDLMAFLLPEIKEVDDSSLLDKPLRFT